MHNDLATVRLLLLRQHSRVLGTVDSEEIKPYRLLFALYTKRMTSKKKKVDNNIILGVKILFSFPLINKMIKTK